MSYKMNGFSGFGNSPLKDRQSRLKRRASKASRKTMEGGGLTDSDVMGFATPSNVRTARKKYRETKRAIRKGTYEYKTESSEGPYYSMSSTETRKQAKAAAKKEFLLTKYRHQSFKKQLKRKKDAPDNPRESWESWPSSE